MFWFFILAHLLYNLDKDITISIFLVIENILIIVEIFESMLWYYVNILLQPKWIKIWFDYGFAPNLGIWL